MKFPKKSRTYIFDFFFEVISVVAVLHEKNDLFLVLGVVVEFYYVLVLELGMDDTLLASVPHLHFAYQLFLHYALLYHGLQYELSLMIFT